MTDTYKVLTIKQPWAWLIFNGKQIENRTWFTKYRGRIFIHAGFGFDKNALNWIINNFEDKYEDCYSILWEVIDHFGISQKNTNEPLISGKPTSGEFGAIIGYVDLKDCVKDNPNRWSMLDCFHWVLENQVLFDKPIYCKGKLNLWNATPDIINEIQKQI